MILRTRSVYIDNCSLLYRDYVSSKMLSQLHKYFSISLESSSMRKMTSYLIFTVNISHPYHVFLNVSDLIETERSI